MSFWPFVLLQMVIFVGLVTVLRLVLSRNLTKATARLQGLSAEYSRRHEELKERLGAAETQYQEQVTRAKTESEQLILQARQEGESSRTKLLDDARRESEKIMQQGLQSRDALLQELHERTEHRAIERACELISEALPAQLRQEIHTHWLEELIHNGLMDLKPLDTPETVQEAKAVSAFPLTAQQQSLLRAKLKSKLGREIPLTESVDPALVAGLTITIGNLVMDGSLASRIQQAARHAQNAT